MTPDELRATVHQLAAGELAPGFTDRLLRALPPQSAPRRRHGFVLAVAAGAAVVVGGALFVRASPPFDGIGSSASPSASISSTPVASAEAEVWPNEVVLSIEMTPGGATMGNRENEKVFVLYRAGEVSFHDYVFGESRSPEKTAYLSPDQMRELVAFAIGQGGLAVAAERYPRISFGPAGSTLVVVNAPDLTKTVQYDLPAGNLVRDRELDEGFRRLVARLSHFSDDVARGDAAGGLLRTQDEAARRIALDDPRLRNVLRSSLRVERVVPVSGDESSVRVFVTIGAPLESWPFDDACELSGGEPTGIVWQIDLVAERITAVSPRIGDEDCFAG